ncbi:MAG: TlpA family protein disulfide reductase [Phaeodactylibacter sp.]|nr:TlpA family protein disulfide reductase [Phaeodactylibacter sp.]
MKKIAISTLIPLLAIGLFVGGRYWYFQPKFVAGATAPVFTGPLLSGKDFNLKELQGSYVLLDFWGSWCGPCRADSPKMVELYDTYHGAAFQKAQGFEIVSIGIEKNPDSWKAAIQKDNLHWSYHLLDQAESLRFFDSAVAGLYQVRQVPTKFLLNPKGVIIAVDPTFEEIRRLLDRDLQ